MLAESRLILYTTLLQTEEGELSQAMLFAGDNKLPVSRWFSYTSPAALYPMVACLAQPIEPHRQVKIVYVVFLRSVIMMAWKVFSCEKKSVSSLTKYGNILIAFHSIPGVVLPSDPRYKLTLTLILQGTQLAATFNQAVCTPNFKTARFMDYLLTKLEIPGLSKPCTIASDLLKLCVTICKIFIQKKSCFHQNLTPQLLELNLYIFSSSEVYKYDMTERFM